MLPGVGRWPMPCAEAKGLLPGRGPVGRCPMPCAEENGLLPGRGAPGLGAALSEAGASDAGAAACSGAGAAGASATGASTFASGAGFGPGLGPGVGAFGPGVGAPGLAAEGFAAAGLAAAGFSSALGLAESSASMAARSLRATGGSIVDEGLLTNSPSSFSFASANLLSTPSSAAISCTRGLAATILLSGSVYPGRADH